MKLHRMVHLRLSDLAGIIANKVRGWIHYYSKVRMSELHYVFRFLNMRLAKWVRNKYRRFRRKHWFYAYKWLQETAKRYPTMFVHLGVRFPFTYSTLILFKICIQFSNENSLLLYFYFQKI